MLSLIAARVAAGSVTVKSCFTLFYISFVNISINAEVIWICLLLLKKHVGASYSGMIRRSIDGMAYKFSGILSLYFLSYELMSDLRLCSASERTVLRGVCWVSFVTYLKSRIMECTHSELTS